MAMPVKCIEPNVLKDKCLMLYSLGNFYNLKQPGLNNISNVKEPGRKKFMT